MCRRALTWTYTCVASTSGMSSNGLKRVILDGRQEGFSASVERLMTHLAESSLRCLLGADTELELESSVLRVRGSFQAAVALVPQEVVASWHGL